jgi:diguanylate cyclase (GGDEF)-like protein
VNPPGNGASWTSRTEGVRWVLVERNHHHAAWEAQVAEKLRAVPPLVGFALAVVLVVSIGGLNAALTVFAGENVVVTIFYLVPVGLAAASAGSRVGLVVAFLAAGAEMLSRWTAGPGNHQHAAQLVISEMLQLPVFAGAAGLVGALRGHLDLMRELARTDPVSGLPNRRALGEMAEVERLRARRSRAPLSLAYVDLDGFKALNDTLGHDAGDRTLRRVGEALRSSVRETDLVARIGGDEFALLLPCTEPSVASAMGERILASVAAAGATNQVTIRASVGIVTFLIPPDSVDALLGAADAAMYRVKNGSKNGVVCAVIDLQTATWRAGDTRIEG